MINFKAPGKYSQNKFKIPGNLVFAVNYVYKYDKIQFFGLIKLS